MQRPSNNAITETFGYHADYPLNGGYHMGVDFSPSPDNKIYAPEDGRYRLYPDNGSLGNAIHMWTGANHHAFGHTSQYLITDNQFCKRGTPIAVMGATGAAYGVHLHWALAVNGSLVDPLTKVNETFKGGEEMIIQNASNWFARCDKTMKMIRGRALGKGEFEKYAVGQEFLKWVEAVEDNKEADQYYAQGQWAKANKDKVLKENADLKATLSKVQSKADLSDSLQKKVDGLLEERKQDEETGSAFIRWIGGLFRKDRT